MLEKVLVTREGGVRALGGDFSYVGGLGVVNWGNFEGKGNPSEGGGGRRGTD